MKEFGRDLSGEKLILGLRKELEIQEKAESLREKSRSFDFETFEPKFRYEVSVSRGFCLILCGIINE